MDHIETEMWDDAMLINAYDNAIGIRHSDVAQILAKDTNTYSSETTKSDIDADDSDGEYKVGDIVRANYDDDGLDYEAEIVDINGSHCDVKFIGYNNVQTVPLKYLIDSWGEDVQNKQRADAKSPEDAENCTERPAERPARNVQCSKGGNVRAPNPGRLPLPPMPPKLPMLHGMTPAESDHFSAMMMSWYMSGYYTGIYQGFRMAQDEPDHNKKNGPSTSRRQ